MANHFIVAYSFIFMVKKSQPSNESMVKTYIIILMPEFYLHVRLVKLECSSDIVTFRIGISVLHIYLCHLKETE